MEDSTVQNTGSSTGDRSTTTKAAQGAGDVVDKAGEQMQVVRDEAQDHVRQLMATTRDELRTQADERARSVASGLRDVARQLSTMSDSVQGDGSLGGIARQASDRAGELAARLESGGVDAVRRDVSAMARRRPGTFLAGSLVAGFLAGRLFRDVQSVASSNGSQPTTSTGTATPRSSTMSGNPIGRPNPIDPAQAEAIPTTLPPSTALPTG